MADGASITVHLEEEPNAIMRFRDEQGQDWLAAAFLGNLIRYENDAVAETVDVRTLRDRAFTLHELKVVGQ